MKTIVPTPYELQYTGSAEDALLNYWIERHRVMYTLYGLSILAIPRTIKARQADIDKVVSSFRRRLWLVVEFGNLPSGNAIPETERQEDRLYLVSPSISGQIRVPLATPDWNINGWAAETLKCRFEEMKVLVALTEDSLVVD
jgi:hypothetical protein